MTALTVVGLTLLTSGFPPAAYGYLTPRPRTRRSRTVSVSSILARCAADRPPSGYRTAFAGTLDAGASS
ncbi:hypothetical protein FHR81_002811 [Actinoalloteichus hoggarensis]|uniref:Uncharacterized protein n=1 Tax=Actinoalloteichus hoggarensis TaxID=1470176 RepID=A0A221VY37_9PSEU|nr:hypothetical protein [Actinoalloteichus hoggarensis]ASO18407.1 hypothetical protein AHOG_03755 [Actinoalloteichus hoggarensis]MBB5921771.1 hypothetical protein [Actinoalloteichus hoggarensis]